MAAPKVFIIILNWNGKQDTIECIGSVKHLDYPNFEIVVVDNGSTDSSEDAIKKKYPCVTIIQTGDNLGYAEGNNIGIRYAMEKDAEYVFLLNNDTIIENNALSQLVNFADKTSKIGIVGPKILLYHDQNVIWFAGGGIDFYSGLSHYGGGKKDDGTFDKEQETDYITGCALLIKSDVINTIGLMDRDYFLLFEEADWCIRARRSGFKLFYVPSARVYHKCSVSFGKIDEQYTTMPPLWIYYYVRNNFLFIKKNYSGRWIFKAYLYCIKRNLVWIKWKCKFQRWQRILSVLCGIFDFLLGRFGRMNESLLIRKYTNSH